MNTFQAYGRALADALDSALPRSLRRIDRLELGKFVLSMSESAMTSMLEGIETIHREHAQALIGAASTVPDEVVVIDSSVGTAPGAVLAKLLLYAECVVCPDPLFEHPLLLRNYAPENLLGRLRQELDVYRSSFLDALSFYVEFGYAIREGLIIATPWHAAVALKQTVDNNFVTEDGAFDSMPTPPGWLESIASECVMARPATFDGVRMTVHSFDKFPREQTSQIALTANDGGVAQKTEMETYMRVVEHRDEGRVRLAKMVQSPPESPALFEQWVRQSQRKLVYNRMVSLQADTVLATMLNGTLLTLSPTNHRILKALASDVRQDRIQPTPASALAMMSLPMLEGLEVNKIVNARQNAERLSNFRAAFRKACGAIKSEVGSPGFSDQVAAIEQDFVNQGVRDISQSYKSLRKKSAIDMALSTSLVTLSVVGVGLGQLQFVPGVVGGIAQIKSIMDAIPKQDDMARHLLYMLWDMTRKPFSSGPKK